MRYLIIILLFYGSAFSKQTDNDVSKTDTICYKFKFNQYDTLVYHIASHDSIIIDYGEPLVKTRFEKVMFICDSIKNNRFYLSATLIDFLSFESSGEIKNVERKDNPWIGRKVWFAIDSVGNRYALGYEDSSKAGLSPGGAFQPHLFFTLKESCKAEDKSWYVETLDELVENGLPVPLMKQSSLFRSHPSLDTLEEHCNRLSYIKTAQGSYKVESETDTFRVTNIVAGYGVMDISANKWIPVHYFATIEQKLTITTNDEEPKPGIHYLATNYTLESFKEGKKIQKNNKIQKKSKK
ncbi:hypothetical protein D9V86_07025 [Bacteroidetes/Chlorobi group bacterium ChocPot_Mid]|jgi:hypothetical protein|nr:MAG: hypothetical protein D9V86_07025 [Bacteroidetes/Chlorobi group bacterium ChocPot_Mid]